MFFWKIRKNGEKVHVNAPLIRDVTCFKLYRRGENIVHKKLSVKQTLKTLQ